MGPIIILDKSALQSLSIENLILLHRYYMPNIVPVLSVEILADLKKTEDLEGQKVIVQKLANKILSFDTSFTIFHLELLRGSLFGQSLKMDGRPVLRGGKRVKAKDGKRGIIFEESAEEIALRRWKEGEFTEAEDQLAERWRLVTRQQDLEAIKKNLSLWFGSLPNFSSLEEIDKYLDYIFEVSTHQQDLLFLLVSIFGEDTDGPSIFTKWFQEGSPKLKIYCPYAIYCLKVYLFCNIGMTQNLLSTRVTNAIDLQYLYYLPFCYVFCSNDKFHDKIVPYFIRKDQYYVPGTVLKKDLEMISKKCKQPDGTNADINFNALEDSDSITYEIWKERMAYLPGTPESGHWRRGDDENNPKTREQTKTVQHSVDLMDELKDHKDAEETNEEFGVDEADYVIKTHSVSLETFCLCGSGKKFGECCFKRSKT